MLGGADNLDVQLAALRHQFGARAIIALYGLGLRVGLDVVAEPAPAIAPAMPDPLSFAVVPFADRNCDPTLDCLPTSSSRTWRPSRRGPGTRSSSPAPRPSPLETDLATCRASRTDPESASWSKRACGRRPRPKGHGAADRRRIGGHVRVETFDADAAAHFDVSWLIAQVIVASSPPRIARAETLRIPPVGARIARRVQAGAAGVGGHPGGRLDHWSRADARREGLAVRSLAGDPECGLAHRTIAEGPVIACRSRHRPVGRRGGRGRPRRLE